MLGISISSQSVRDAAGGRQIDTSPVAVGRARPRLAPSSSAGSIRTSDVEVSSGGSLEPAPPLPKVTIAEPPPEYRGDIGAFSRLQHRPGLGIKVSDTVRARVCLYVSPLFPSLWLGL